MRKLRMIKIRKKMGETNSQRTNSDSMKQTAIANQKAMKINEQLKIGIKV